MTDQHASESLEDWHLTPPDGDGFVWLVRGNEMINLGRADYAGERFSEWLERSDFGE